MLIDNKGMTYTYNALDRLTRVVGTNLDVSYVYDGDGLRIAKTNNLTNVTTNYLWDTQNYTGSPQYLRNCRMANDRPLWVWVVPGKPGQV